MSDHSSSLSRKRMQTEDMMRGVQGEVRIKAARFSVCEDVHDVFLALSRCAMSEDLRRFRPHMAERQIGVSTITSAIAALRFFSTMTLERPDLVALEDRVRAAHGSVALSHEEVACLHEAAPVLSTRPRSASPDGAGLRVSEVVNLKVSDIP